MKRLVLIVLVLVALLAACTPKKQVPELEVAEQSRSAEGPSEALSAIDSLMWQRPDSALTLLLPWFDDCRDVACNVYTENDNGNSEEVARYVSADAEYDRHYANLLLSELLYKNDSAQTNRQELLQAVAYFDSLSAGTRGASLQGFCRRDTPRVSANRPSIAFLSARSHYMNGVGYYENDSVVEACQEYMKALDIMQDHFEEKELVGHKAQFMALAYTRLTMLFSDLYLHEQAVYFGELALNYYDCYDTYAWHKAWILDEIGSHFEMIEQLDSACYYYQKAATSLNDTNVLMYRDIKTHQAHLKYKTGGKPEVSIQQLHGLLSKAENDRDSLARLLALGEIYYYEKQYDSARFFLNIVYRKSSSIGSKKQAAEWLIEICKAQGDEEELQVYSDFLIPFANQEENTSATKSQLTELYNTFKISALDQQHRQVMQKSKTRAIAVLCSLLVVILVITLLFHRNKKKLKQFESVEHDESEIQAKAWDKYTSFIEEPVCQDIIRSVQGENIKRLATPKDYPDLVMSEEQLQQLAFMVNRYFGPFEYHLEQHGVKASPIMSSLCHLFLLGIDEKQAAILLDRDYSSISRYVKKLKTAFGTQESLSVYFRNLVLNN